MMMNIKMKLFTKEHNKFTLVNYYLDYGQLKTVL